MPNWCYTNIQFRGGENQIIWLDEKIEEWTRKNYIENGFGRTWLGNIVAGSEISTIEEIKTGTCPRCRGSITYQNKDSANELTIATETAWAPMMEMWDKINTKYNLGLNIIYSADEPGCELYVTNDPDLVDFYIFEVWNDVRINGEYLCSSYDLPDDKLSEGRLKTYLQSILNSQEEDINELIHMFKESEFSKYASIYKWEYAEIDELV